MSIIHNRLKYVLSPQFDIYEQIANVVRDKVADIGFGTGFGMHLLTANAKEVYGFEVDADSLQFARRVFPFKNAHYELGDIVKGIPGTYDYVVMIDVIEHIPEYRRALENVKAILNEGGTLICSTPNRMSRYRKAETHFREYSPDEFKSILSEVFDKVSLRNYRLEPLVSEYENPMIGMCK